LLADPEPDTEPLTVTDDLSYEQPVIDAIAVTDEKLDALAQSNSVWDPNAEPISIAIADGKLDADTIADAVNVLDADADCDAVALPDAVSFIDPDAHVDAVFNSDADLQSNAVPNDICHCIADADWHSDTDG
jgi:hypothetical protein